MALVESCRGHVAYGHGPRFRSLLEKKIGVLKFGGRRKSAVDNFGHVTLAGESEAPRYSRVRECHASTHSGYN